MPRLGAVGLALVCVVATFVGEPRSGVAQAAGNGYVSGTYGFEIGWDDRIWYVIGQEVDDPWEDLTLSDGRSFLFFSAGTGYGGDARSCLADVVATLVNSRGIEHLQQQVDDRGDPIEGDDNGRMFAAYTYSYDLGDGMTIDFARYVECQTMIAGESVIIADAIAPLDQSETESNLAQDVIDEIVLPSPGEPAPVFVSDPWRLAVAGAEQAGEIKAAGLAPRDNKDWLVLVLDATNLQAERDELNVKDFLLRVDGQDDPIGIAPSSTVAAADELGTGPASANRGVSFRTGQTRRLTLAFLVPAGTAAPVLLHEGSALPLLPLLDEGAGLDDLRATATPPFMREARVNEVLSGGRLAITYTSDDSDATIELAGIEGLSDVDCHGRAYLDAVSVVVGETIRFEREPAKDDSAPDSGYVWTVSDDGVPTQLNQHLLAQGDAALSSSLDDTRFGAWLTESSQDAQQAERGLWGECVEAVSRQQSTVSRQLTPPLRSGRSLDFARDDNGWVVLAQTRCHPERSRGISRWWVNLLPMNIALPF